MLSPSDILVRPTSLTERLAAEAPAEPPPLPEPTPTTMAERFAPEAQKAAGRRLRSGRRARTAGDAADSSRSGAAPLGRPRAPGCVDAGVAGADRDHPRCCCGRARSACPVPSDAPTRSPDQAEPARWRKPSRPRSPPRRRSTSRPLETQGRDRADGAGPDRGQDRRGARLRHRHRFRRARCRRAASSPSAPCPQAPPSRKGAPTAPPEWNLTARRDRRSAAQAAEDGKRQLRSARRADGGRRHDPRQRHDQARHRAPIRGRR